MVDKERIYYQSVLKINRENIFKVCMIHSSHIQVGQDIINGGLRSDYRKIIEDLTKQDAVVLLTNRQKEHIEVRFGQHDNLYVIPHSIEKEISRVDFEKRIPKRAIYLGRYSAEKQQDSLIRSFSKVVQNHTDAQLHMYGFGDSEQIETLKKLIKELGLENNVFINDFVDNPGEIYDSASLAVLPSRIEGFSLFLLEGISHGCPVISYDIDYGPKDMIDEGENGYLVEPDNEDKMAQRIIELFNDEEKLIAMSEASYKKADSFKSEIIAEKWSILIDKVLQGKLI
jgi:poly(glycerol-phosphate) alpha-glucosyltransferase